MTGASPVILARGDGWIAIDKPPGEVVIPARHDDPLDCTWRRAEATLGARLWVVHRIDRDTSGIVLFATDAEAHRTLSMAFEHGRVSKTYVALTRGFPPGRSGTIDTPLHPARKGKMRPALPREPGALPAITDWSTLSEWNTPAGTIGWLEARPRTGRQHQIRVHLRSVGAPLLVDPLYGRSDRLLAHEVGGSGQDVVMERLTLHARRIELDAPRGGRIAIEAPLAGDLGRVLELLGTPVWSALR